MAIICKKCFISLSKFDQFIILIMIHLFQKPIYNKIYFSQNQVLDLISFGLNP